MTPSEHLRLAAALIADEDRWTREFTARDIAGEPCEPDSPDACQWCAVGALSKTSPSFHWDEVYEFKKVYGVELPALNDSAGHAYTIGAMMHVADKLDGLA